ncbi:hypothetical protein [Duganella sp.]|uniref:arsenate reductase/protein-tyrosine-phosphatase family protein n=1 Tax=Duganella sp. TaxID=1904440 RepID=UPI0031E34ED5
MSIRVATAARYGSWRGAVRLLLARLALRCGLLRAFRLRHPQRVRRVVFVCLGNICRSAYAQCVAAGIGMPAASIGLATCTGALSPAAAVHAALRCGADLTMHRATDMRDFGILPGDLFIAMEIRQARELRRRLAGRNDIQIALLGLWCTPATPHLHDPYTLSDAYFDHCFARLHQAVHALHHTLKQSAP